MQDLCNAGLNLLRTSLKTQWNRVDGAVYFRAPDVHLATGEKKLKFDLVANMDLLETAQSRSSSPFTEHTLYLASTTENDTSAIDTTSYLLQNEMVHIPGRSCALFPLVNSTNDIVGLFLLSVPLSDKLLISDEAMQIVNQSKALLLAGLDQYNSMVRAHRAATHQKQITKSMLAEGRGAVKSVRSYAKILSFRPTGALEKDMIDGIEHQGERMSNIVRRLENALVLGFEPISGIPSDTNVPFAPPPFLEN